MTAGFSGEILAHLFRLNPHAINSKTTLTKLQFWREFAGNNDEILSRIIRRNSFLIQQDINNKWVPKINLLEEYGLSQENIVKLLASGRSLCMYGNVDRLKQALERIDELGFPRGSGTFIAALQVAGSLKGELWDKKVEFYKNTYGWSEEQVLSAFKKCPTFFYVPHNIIERKMDFLVKEAAIDLDSLASKPFLLGRSLEKCLVPRHRVLCILKEKGFNKKFTLSNARPMSNKDFVDKFVEPYKEKIPELAMAYHAACDGEELTV